MALNVLKNNKCTKQRLMSLFRMNKEELSVNNNEILSSFPTSSATMGSSDINGNNNINTALSKSAMDRSESTASTCSASSSYLGVDEQPQPQELQLQTTTTGRKKSVQFDTVEIREHEQLMDVHPSVSSGPAVGLGWLYHDIPKKFDLTEFETARLPQRRCHRTEFRMPRCHRETLLLDLGYTRRDLTDNIKKINFVKRQRHTSAQQTIHNEKFLIGIESANQWIRNVFRLR